MCVRVWGKHGVAVHEDATDWQIERGGSLTVYTMEQSRVKKIASYSATNWSEVGYYTVPKTTPKP